MPDLPSALALTTIADGADIVASDHRNNYSAIETGVNDLITALTGGTSGKVVTATDSDTVSYKYPPGHEYGYKEFTSAVTVTATTAAGADSIVAADSITFDGTAVWVEFYSPEALPAGSSVTLSLILYDNTAGAALGRIGAINGPLAAPVHVRRKITPASGARIYSVRACTVSGSASVGAGTGGTSVDSDMPGYIRITKA